MPIGMACTRLLETEKPHLRQLLLLPLLCLLLAAGLPLLCLLLPCSPLRLRLRLLLRHRQLPAVAGWQLRPYRKQDNRDAISSSTCLHVDRQLRCSAGASKRPRPAAQPARHAEELCQLHVTTVCIVMTGQHSRPSPPYLQHSGPAPGLVALPGMPRQTFPRSGGHPAAAKACPAPPVLRSTTAARCRAAALQNHDMDIVRRDTACTSFRWCFNRLRPENQAITRHLSRIATAEHNGCAQQDLLLI